LTIVPKDMIVNCYSESCTLAAFSLSLKISQKLCSEPMIYLVWWAESKSPPPPLDFDSEVLFKMVAFHSAFIWFG